MNTAQTREAIATHLVSGDNDLARQLADGLSHEQLVELTLDLSRMYGFGLVDSFQRSGLSVDVAKQMAVEHFRRFAHFEVLREEGTDES